MKREGVKVGEETGPFADALLDRIVRLRKPICSSSTGTGCCLEKPLLIAGHANRTVFIAASPSRPVLPEEQTTTTATHPLQDGKPKDARTVVPLI